MPRFFCDTIYESEAHICGEDARHITKVLRMRVGETLVINDMQGFDYDCEVAEFGDVVKLNIQRKYKNQTEPSVKITLYQCLPKGDKLDFIIQKAVELGVCRIVPVASKFCVAKVEEAVFAKKLVRYQKIALEAAKQSGRGIIPQVLPILSFREAVDRAKSTTAILFYEGGGERVCNLVDTGATEVSVFVGSEGGFCVDEVDFALANGVFAATLGKLILRCETAPIAGVTLVLTATQNM